MHQYADNLQEHEDIFNCVTYKNLFANSAQL
jgi:hypothetical protein